MHHQYLNEPMVLDVGLASTLTLTLPSNISDFIVLEAMGGPLLELIVVSETPQPQIAVRFQPILGLKLNAVVVDAASFTTSSLRHRGQGVRLYPRLGTAPKFCAQELRTGISIKVDVPDGVALSLQSASKFELVTLESDVRSLHEPKVLMMAKAILAREYDYNATAESLAVCLTEIEQVRLELQAFLRGEVGLCHASLAEEAVRLDPLLQQKRQWLFRTYTHMFERPNFSRAANDGLNIDKALRKLECFELLASPELLQMVERLMEDEA
ncbi:hypothetical protein [Shewanella sp. Koi 1]